MRAYRGRWNHPRRRARSDGLRAPLDAVGARCIARRTWICNYVAGSDDTRTLLETMRCGGFWRAASVRTALTTPLAPLAMLLDGPTSRLLQTLIAWPAFRPRWHRYSGESACRPSARRTLGGVAHSFHGDRTPPRRGVWGGFNSALRDADTVGALTNILVNTLSEPLLIATATVLVGLLAARGGELVTQDERALLVERVCGMLGEQWAEPACVALLAVLAEACFVDDETVDVARGAAGGRQGTAAMHPRDWATNGAVERGRWRLPRLG